MSALLPSRRLTRRRDVAPEPLSRTNISDSDRQRPSVRVWLGIGQVVVLAGLLIAGLGPLIWLALAAVSPTASGWR